MEYAVEEIEGRHGLTARVVVDQEYRDIRREYDHLGTIAGGDYGDEPLGRYFDDYYGSVGEKIRELRLEGYTVLPVRSLDYGSSGATVEVCDLEDANAYAYVTPQALRMEYGATDERARRRARKLLAAEIDELDAAANGEIYGDVIEDAEGERVDSCWGFVDRDAEYTTQEARDQLKHAETAADAEEAERREMEARDVVTVA